MDLTLHPPGSHHFIRSVDEQGIRVGEQRYRHSIALDAEHLEAFPVGAFEQLTVDSLEPVMAWQPELLVIGTGAVSVIPRQDIIAHCYRAGMGVEFMPTPAACRTFNVLMSEDRRAAAILLQDDGTDG